MNEETIIEKAKQLGIDPGNVSQREKIHAIAEQLGVEDLDELNDTLDSMLNGSNEDFEPENLDDSANVETLDDVGNLESNVEGQEERPKRFGEEEYNAAKNEDGTYNKDYYKDKQKELDEKVEKAKEQKEKKTKDVETKNEKGEKVTGQKNKNIFDKAKDNRDLRQAKNERFMNKLNSAKAKAYNVTHPGEALKNKTKEVVKNTAKNTAKKAGKAAGKAAKKGAEAIGALIKKNPYVLIAIVGAAVLLLIILLFAGNAGSEGYIGLNGYDYIEPKCTEITISEGDYAGTYDLEEYIAGVTYAEVGGFASGNKREAAKAGAIAARSFVQANIGDDCTVISSQSFQVYKTPNESSIEVANETRGLVLVENEKIKSTMYDAFCTDYPQDDPDNYIVCQQHQKIPRSWVDAQNGIAESWKNGTMSGAHGKGMSQWGAAYLAEQGYDFEKILNYYYSGSELMSLYKSYEISNNWIYEISAATTSTIPSTILNIPLNELLSETEYDNLNDAIYEGVISSGVGTRDAIVSTAVTPIKYLAENHNVVIPYALAGGHFGKIMSTSGINLQKTTTTYFGLDPDWGTPINHVYDGKKYDNYGPDCSGFVPWVFYNAGVSISPRTAGYFQYLGKRHEMGGDFIAAPGDILESDGHVTVIVGVDVENKLYYIAHARGGSYGTVITPVSFNSSYYYIVDMSEYIEQHRMKDYETIFMNGVLEY